MTAYYIDYSYSGGSDNGSFATPWSTHTLVNAASFSPGDFLLLRRGTYITTTTGLIIPDSGESGNIITVGAYYWDEISGEEGIDITSSALGEKPIIQKVNADISQSGWTDTTVNNEYTFPSATAQQLLVGTRLTFPLDGSICVVGSGPTALNEMEVYYDADNDLVYFKPEDGNTPANYDIRLVSGTAAVVVTDRSYITVENLNPDRTTTGVLADGLNTACSNIIVQDSLFTTVRTGALSQSREGKENDSITFQRNNINDALKGLECGAVADGAWLHTNVSITNNNLTDIDTNRYWDSFVAGDNEGISLQNLQGANISSNSFNGGCYDNAIVTWQKSGITMSDVSVNDNAGSNIGSRQAGSGFVVSVGTGSLPCSNVTVDGTEAYGSYGTVSLAGSATNSTCSNTKIRSCKFGIVESGTGWSVFGIDKYTNKLRKTWGGRR